MSTRGRSWIAPSLAMLLLAGLATLHFTERDTSGGVDMYMERAGARIDEVPLHIGRFIGQTAAVAPEVENLLKPNRVLQRRYVDPYSTEPDDWFSLVIVHCGVAKDMFGHYPPNCYPRAGWTESVPAEDVVVRAGELTIPARLYRYTRESGMTAQRQDILSFFVVPSAPDRFGADDRMVDMASRTAASDKLGAAQVQILTPTSMSEERRKAIWSEVLEAIVPVLNTIAEGA
ncbi:MAG: exosortase-associated EpsI family protein [Planctomycetota bacterium]|nr:exosortase-associated EpsI family protein [Planctomycetota bacterium]